MTDLKDYDEIKKSPEYKKAMFDMIFHGTGVLEITKDGVKHVPYDFMKKKQTDDKIKT